MRPQIKHIIRTAFELRLTIDDVNSYYKTETNAKHYICIYPFNNHKYFKQVFDKSWYHTFTLSRKKNTRECNS